MNILQKDHTKIAPGPMDEERFMAEAHDHMLPQYVNSFLLAKDIELEFRGVSAKTSAHMLSRNVKGTLGISYGPFNLGSGSVGYGSTSKSTSTEVTANGIRISVHGAQVIGYYTTVVNKFPPQDLPDVAQTVY